MDIPDGDRHGTEIPAARYPAIALRTADGRRSLTAVRRATSSAV